MKGDVGMSGHEKERKQEDAYTKIYPFRSQNVVNLHIKNVNKTRTFLNFDPVGGRHGGIIFKKTPTQPLKWSVGT